MVSTSTLPAKTDRIARLIIFVAWAFAAVPALAQKLLGENRQLVLNRESADLAIVAQSRIALAVLLLATCAFSLWQSRLDCIKGSRVSLWCFLLPFFVFGTAELLRGNSVSISALIYPILVLTFWRCGPSVHCLSTLGICGGATASVSLVLGLFYPGLGLYYNYDGELATVDKGLFSDNLLSGIFGSANNLGQFLALSFGCALLIARRGWRWWAIGSMIWAICWSGSRSSIVVVVVVLLLGLLTSGIKAAWMKAVSATSIATTFLLCLLLPFFDSMDPGSFTGRGNMWRAGIAAWEKEPIWGLGAAWYREVAQTNSSFGQLAAKFLFHGHNQFLHILVTGGAITLGLTMVLVLFVAARAIQLTDQGLAIGTMVVVAFLTSGLLELNLGYLDRSLFLVTALVPLAVIGLSRESRGTGSHLQALHANTAAISQWREVAGITAQQYLRILCERWVVIVIAMVLGLGGALAAFFLHPPEYTAKITFYVSAYTSDSAQAAFQGGQFSQHRVISYTELLTHPRIVSEVMQKLRLPETPDALAKEMTATSKIDSMLLEVSVADRSPLRAAQIADAVGEIFPRLVDEIERQSSTSGVPPISVRVVGSAATPAVPSTAGLPVTLALGLLAGLAVGSGGALSRRGALGTILSPDQLRNAAGAPNLGSIVYDPQVPEHPLTVHEDAQSPRAEAFRILRTNLQFVDIDNPNKVIVVTSSMPTEGKTTTLLNLAIAMSSVGARVLVIDANLRKPNVADFLGLESSVGLTSILAGQHCTEQAIQPWGDGAFDVIPSGPLPPNPCELLASRHMRVLLRELRQRYDLVLIDSPALLSVADAATMAPATDGAILVCRYRSTTQRKVETAAQALRAVSSPILGTVITMAATSGRWAYAHDDSSHGIERALRPAACAAIGNRHNNRWLSHAGSYRAASLGSNPRRGSP